MFCAHSSWSWRETVRRPTLSGSLRGQRRPDSDVARDLLEHRVQVEDGGVVGLVVDERDDRRRGPSRLASAQAARTLGAASASRAFARRSLPSRRAISRLTLASMRSTRKSATAARTSSSAISCSAGLGPRIGVEQVLADPERERRDQQRDRGAGRSAGPFTGATLSGWCPLSTPRGSRSGASARPRARRAGCRPRGRPSPRGCGGWPSRDGG